MAPNFDKLFVTTDVKFLGHILNVQGIATDLYMVKSILDFQKPKTAKQLTGFVSSVVTITDL